MSTAHHSRALLFLVGSSALATVDGCAAAQAEETGSTESAQRTVPRAAEELGSGGATARLSDDTLYLKADQQTVHFPAGGNFVTVCESGADPALLSRIKDMMTGRVGAPHIVLKKADGKFETRTSNLPTHETDVYFCKGGRLGGSAYQFHLWETDGGFLKDIDLSAAFFEAISGEKFECDAAVSLNRPIGLEVKGFRVEDGKVQQPEVTLDISGNAGKGSATARARCMAKAAKSFVVFAGPVPVFFEVEVLVGVQVSTTRGGSFSGKIGTRGGHFEVTGGDLTVTPQVELGVTFYGVLGGYVGIDLPIAIEPKPPCSPNITMGVTFRAGVEVGLLGIGNSAHQKGLGFEAGTSLLGPYTLQASRCKP